MFAIVRAVPDGVQQLPRGRHGLPREQVLASQRGRMLQAIAEAVADKGYARVTVADVISRAGVSRETFYEQFEDKEAAFPRARGAAPARRIELQRRVVELVARVLELSPDNPDDAFACEALVAAVSALAT